MASADDNVTWHEGDRCLAPSSRDGNLREATILRLFSTTFDISDAFASVVFADAEKGEKEEEGVLVPISKLQKISSINNVTEEKPFFPSSFRHHGTREPLVMSQGDEVPYTINRYLRDYQREGIRFIYDNYARSRGCILGDDMGLGKTVQVIGFLAAVLHKTGTWKDVDNNRPQFLLTQVPSQQSKPKKVFLIVAPLSVLYNWKDELETWGHFQSVVVHGLKKEEELTRIKNGRSEIALTTYETLRLSLDQFNSIKWSAVIVDEAHKIKNPKSQITQAMKELTCQIRIGLTGTILQNNLEELWCVMDWAIPTCLGSLGYFKNKISYPIEQGQKHTATKRTLATARKAVRALAKKISRWFLRRTKALIKDQLPKKDDRVVYCSLTDFQETVYKTVLESEDVTLLLRSREKCDCQSGRTRQSCCYEKNSEGMSMKTLYFSYLSILRKVANHAALLQSTAGTSELQKKLVGAVCEKVFQKFPDFVQRCKDEAFEAMSDPMYSGKMMVLQKLLKYYMQRRDKVLLFSLSTKLLDVLESYCMAEGLDYSRLDGTTNSRERIKIVKEFNSSPLTSLCLVSTMAGGLGLNFVGANVVILFDPTWNPANDLQAIDRAYRIGQCRDVSVLRLISLGTVEEVMYLRQVYKQQLESSVVGRQSARRYFEAVQGTDGQKGELFGTKNLFRLQTKGTCLTRTILEREGRVEAGVMMTSCTHMDDEEGEEEEEEERKRAAVGENGPKLNDEAAKENRDASGTARGVLDFSSGSEDEEEWGARRKALDETGATDASTDPGRLSLLQHGFSRLLQRAAVKPGSGLQDSSPSEGESGASTDLEDDGKVPGSSGEKDSPLPGGLQEHARMNRSSPLGERDNSRREKPGPNDVMKAKNRIVEEGDGGSSGSETSDEAKATKAKTLPRPQHFACHSDESDDLELCAVTRPKMARWGDKGRGTNRKETSSSGMARPRAKHTEHIESFTSSDEEHTHIKRPRRGHVTTTSQKAETHSAGALRDGQRGQTGGHKVAERTDRAVSFTGLKSQAAPGSKGMEATIDNVLGGLQGVAYTHSNQRVVGGSKAEERISRAALRDVFERNMYSQVPANLLLGSAPEESLSDESPPDSPVLRGQRAATERPGADHPPTFTKKIIHRTRHTTFILGQTPPAICRQQLEEMSAKFQSPSVRQFAEEVLRSSSAQRLTWLQQHYTSLDHPELADMVRKHFPEPDSAQPEPETTTAHPPSSSSSKHKATNKRHSRKSSIESHSQSRTAQQSGPQRHKKPRTPCRNIEEPQIDVPNPQLEERAGMAREHKRIKRASVSTCGAFAATAAIDGGGLGSDMASSSGMRPGKEAAAAAFLNHRDTDTPSSPDVSHGQPATSSKPTVQGREREMRPSARTREAALIQRGNLHSPSPPDDAPSTSKGRLGCLLTDLIGDTSILDDLFRSKPKAARPPKTPPASANLSKPTTTAALVPSSDTTRPPSTSVSHTHPALVATLPSQRSKGSRKDFWDILNEGNEESINRLTDPSEVERVCVRSTNTTAGRTRAGEDGESAVLWKTNDKFLWKR